MINVNFWFNNKNVFSWWTETYPHYHKDDIIWLEQAITPIGEQKWENAERMTIIQFIIERVEHSLKLEYSKDIDTFCSLDIYIVQPTKEQ